ncbi:MAG: glycine--tRNA ligase subunit alpha [bacterium (Candidatus Ratteibacteria) CG_4_10_14_3_um_filter_41_18]|uniref:Glycine--tRNA ligase alpha subunit n=4 Tax=Candidatus Ratteibacteria TaxID=2979319 RepID=A0A2M7EA59_9BACT|nr:MAG: glycine--tRNA ligase subunit alpha [Candidatus Omnitrophica bacterium CG1_02_41_171]PIV64632.1 MAG: glycine--tRNA ligase subunit alpha [bacterium (Candidatus Ratteibacteria) CG01_land_8_20_14_3_00_40_19]PIW34186.1 MAG: glycine--tRNA ligase subunit alpha [bacterium (Candidatus Ratteibacteria) CG15_BIG_FIL_POST_REV_8_21_14_020_41_12]PIW74483.1 MAG: glycine--tRNA ligase subunit alpha [bacterium (Candidatus Ratteibacteria) CG_4_8_14_3_um_filter_41_36]PIX77524.1 MAG: glycine--tRNA ligase sub
MTFQEIRKKLEDFWIKKGCLLWHPYGTEVGAGTLNPATFFKILGPEPWQVVYLEPSKRPADGRYGDNPLRTYEHFQLQVILKPPPKNVQNLYCKSLEVLGIKLVEHDLRFMEDNWEAPTLGAWGVGWEVWLDGLEITQFTYLQQAGGIDLSPVSAELTYGLERIATYIQKVKSLFDLEWGKGITYGDLQRRKEKEFSQYNFKIADTKLLLELFDRYEAESTRLLKENLALPAYDYVLKCSHAFNLLEARGAISVSERLRFIERVRKLAKQCALLYLEKNHKI